MSYSNFTLPAARTAFQLEEEDIAGLFSNIEPVVPSKLLTDVLARNIPLATAIATEKAKSELIVANVLVELREQLEHRISLFSGIDFNVDAELGLTGVCDFLVSLSPIQFDLQAPIIVLVEARTITLKSVSVSAWQRWLLPNILMLNMETTFREFMVLLRQAFFGVSSNWKGRNYRLICFPTKLSDATKFSEFFQVW